MITKEKIIEILHSHSYNVEDQAGNHLIVVDDDSWDEIAEQVKNCSIPDVALNKAESEVAVCDNPNCEDGIVDRDYYGHPIYCQVCEQTDC